MGKMKRWCALVISFAMIATAFPPSTGRALAAGETELTGEQVQNLYQQFEGGENYGRVSVHDPSVVVGYIDEENYSGSSTVYGEQNDANTRREVYFIFGSHMAFAYSTDLKSWKTFTNNIEKTYKTMFATNFDWADNGDTVYNPANNMWAPDVIWNPDYAKPDGTKGAWMMYMSINGCSWNSSIALLTADTLNGDWTYQGTVVYSGFNSDGVYSYAQTDYAEVTGDTSLPDCYVMREYSCKDGESSCSPTSWNTNYGAHAIDPCVVRDGDDLWMTYGSWSGGIWMLKMDGATGLRDAAVKYERKANESDPYMGYKLAGGDFASGEASYIQKIGEKYYLFISNGGLISSGGYNMRVFSSDAIVGPYKDMSGDDARHGTSRSGYAAGTYSTNAGAVNGTVGNRLMSYYKWSFMNSGFVAQGHNSAFVDDDGKAYIVYHTRYTASGEVHNVRVHQIFVAQNGGLVTAPFEYCGETLSDQAYSTDDVSGSYQILTMGDTDYGNQECVTEKTISLNTDGTVTGAYAGTWAQSADGPYVKLVSGGVTYQGVFVEQKMEGKGWPVMCLTLVGSNDLSIWGYGKVVSDDLAVAKCASELQPGIHSMTYSDISLPTEDAGGVQISWESSNQAIITPGGKVTAPAVNTEVTLTATFRRGNYSCKKEYATVVCAGGLAGIDTSIGMEAYYNFDSGITNEQNSAQTGKALSQTNGKVPELQEDEERGSNIVRTYSGVDGARSYVRLPNPLKGKNADGVTVSIWVKPDSTTNVWDEIWSFYNDSTNRLFLTRNVFFGYNNGNGNWFDCNNGATVTNALKAGKWHHVTVSIKNDSFAIYIDGALRYTESINVAFGGSSYDASMGQRVLDLVNTASNFYLGYGAFWSSGNISMDNLKIYGRALVKEEAEKLYDEEKTSMEEQSAAMKAEKDKANSNVTKPDPGQTEKPDPGQTEKPDQNQTGDPDQNQTEKPDPSQTEKPGQNQTGDPDQNQTEKPDPNQAGNPDQTSRTEPAVQGKTYTVGKLKYKVTSVGSKKTVTVTGTKTRALTAATIGKTVRIQGTSFKVTKIGNSAFAGCRKLKKVVIGANVTAIGKKAFKNCSKLKTISVKTKALKSVGSNALKGIAKKAGIRVPSSRLKKYKALFKKKGQSRTVKIKRG